MSIILSPYRESLGKTHNIYAAPQWVRVDGTWGTIDEVLTVKYNGHESYEIQLGKDRIFFEPLWDAMPYALSRVISSRAFGPVLDLGLVKQKDLGWRVTTSGAVSRTEEGWVFDRCEPKICGLFFDKWVGLMPKAVTVTDNEVWINTKTALADISSDAVTPTTLVNLDPDTVTPVANGYAYVYRAIGETWQQTIDGAGTGNAVGLECGTWDRAVPPINYIYRLLLRFDTSAYPTPIDAYLRANIDPPTFESAEERDYLAATGEAALNFPLADNANYAKAKTAIDSHGIGAMVPVGDIDQGFRKSPDIVAAGEWESSATADFVLSEHYDYTEEAPNAVARFFTYTLLGYPRLEITPGAMGNRIPLMNAGVT